MLPSGTKLYLAFGKVLEGWRTVRYPTIRQMFDDARHLSLSYRMYSAFERGESLPNGGQLIELVSLFRQDREFAVVRWTQAQMAAFKAAKETEFEDEQAQKFFNEIMEKLLRSGEGVYRRDSKAASRAVVLPSSLDNTWVLGPGDFNRFMRAPWLWDVCNFLLMRYPHPVKLSDLPLPKGVSAPTLLTEHLKPWIESGHIVVEEEGLKTSQPYLRVPETDQATPLRVQNMQRIVSELYSPHTAKEANEGRAIRKTLLGNLSAAQANVWVEKLKRLEQEFFEDTAMDEPGRSPHVLLFGFCLRNGSTGYDIN